MARQIQRNAYSAVRLCLWQTNAAVNHRGQVIDTLCIKVCVCVAAHLFCRHQVLMDSNMPILRCDCCSFVTDKRSRYDDHIKMHRNIRDMPCALCGKLFVTKKTLRQHVAKVHQRVSATNTTNASPPPVAIRSLVLPTQV